MVALVKSLLVGLAAAWANLATAQTQSPLGTINQTDFPQFLSSSSNIRELTAAAPWGDETAKSADPYHYTPQGTVRNFEWVVSRGVIAPDGVSRSVLLVNGQFPGPTIQANWGDTIRVLVHNNITGPGESTAIHWHGLLQKGTPYEDGTPGVAQCPIPPGSSFTYTFKADLFGSSFYHSHYSSQYTGGLFGAMVIYGPSSAGYDVDKGPLLLGDWGHKTYEQEVVEAVGAGQTGAVFSDSSLINGKIDAKYAFTSGKTYRLRLINAGAEAAYTFSIDEHNFTVIAHDFVPVEPYTASYVRLGIGQRADIIVKATGDPKKSYWMRSAPSDCSLLNNKTAARAAIFYQDASRSQLPSSTPQQYDTGCTFNDITTDGVPSFAWQPPAEPATMQALNISYYVNSTDNPVWAVNGGVYHVDYDEPPLLLAHARNVSRPHPKDWNLYNFGSNSSVRLVVYNTSPFTSHPMHMHGHNFWILAQGYGAWDGRVTASPSNPPRRDTFMLNAAKSAAVADQAYIVVEYEQDNPGVWLFHCHIAWHIAGGLGLSLLERPDDIARMNIPADLDSGCAAFRDWQKTHVVDEIDSGLR